MTASTALHFFKEMEWLHAEWYKKSTLALDA